MFNAFSEHHRKEAIAASGELTQALVDHLNVGWASKQFLLFEFNA